MEQLLNLLKEHGPLLLQLGGSLLLGGLGGVGTARLAIKKQRRVLANLQRQIMVLGTTENDLVDQHRLIKSVELFNVSELGRSSKALDHLTSDHRLLVVGYSETALYQKAFERAASRCLPILVYAKPGAIKKKEDLEQISDYAFASVCNTDLRLVSDVFAVMSTFPENK